MQCTYNLGATARRAMTMRGSGIQVPTASAHRLRHDESTQPMQAHGPWLTNPAAPAQAGGSLSGCHFCILPRRGSLHEPAGQPAGPVSPGRWRDMCVICTSMSHVSKHISLAAVRRCAAYDSRGSFVSMSIALGGGILYQNIPNPSKTALCACILRVYDAPRAVLIK